MRTGPTQSAPTGVPAVELTAMFEGPWSITQVSSQVATALADPLDGLALRSTNGTSYWMPELARLDGPAPNAPVGIHWGFPDDIEEDFFACHDFHIGAFTCETDRVPATWVAASNRLDLVIVPSTFGRSAFRDSGVTAPVMVVPHGLEPEYRPTRARSRHHPLVFYNTFHASSLVERKGIDELAAAFLEAFGPSGTDAVLHLRTQLTGQLAAVGQRHDFGDAIKLLPFVPLDTSQFARLYEEAHCTVHPSRGEGFGLVPLQSIACDTPVIATGATGLADYLDASNSIPLRPSGRACGSLKGNAEGEYFVVDHDHLVESLLDMTQRWEHHQERTLEASADIRERYAWPTVLAEFVDIVAQATDGRYRPTLPAELQERFGAGR